MDFGKLLSLFTSRKFLAAVAAILTVFQVIPAGEESAFHEALLTVVTAASYIFATAIESK